MGLLSVTPAKAGVTDRSVVEAVNPRVVEVL
jgi:hypothetical protein